MKTLLQTVPSFNLTSSVYFLFSKPFRLLQHISLLNCHRKKGSYKTFFRRQSLGAQTGIPGSQTAWICHCNVKISYSLLPNIKSIINTHRKILYMSPTTGTRTCNCINTSQCPLQQRCISNNILYQANITPLDENSETKIYYGICKTTFKLRYAKHKKLFNYKNPKLDTEQSNEFWRIRIRQQTQHKHNMRDFRQIPGI